VIDKTADKHVLFTRAALNNESKPVEINCPSCGGLNLSCPDGCGRDPRTGELNGTRLSESKPVENG
jgi:hypothetical protein